jgi:hypothetical protein
MRALFIILISMLCFSGCDGRKSKAESLKDAVTQFKDSLEFIEYIPKEYAEMKTDTILSNGFSISIKTYTNMKKSVITKHTIDSILHIQHHRDWISEVKIKRKNQLLFNEKIDMAFFAKNNINILDSIPNAINTRVWLDDDAPIEKDSINLLTVFLNPEDDNFILYRIKIGNQGTYSLKKLETY